MGETRASFRRASNRILLVFGALGIAAYLLMPYTNPLLAAAVFGVCAFVVLMALFVRFIW